MNGQRSLLAAGIGSLGRWRLIALLTLSTALLALLAAAPLWPALDSAFSGTLAGNHVLLDHPSFAPTDAFDFLREKSSAVAGTRQSALWTALLAVLLQVAFAGGIVGALGRPGPFSWDEFWSGCRRHAWHNAKCLLLFVSSLTLLPGLWVLAAGWATRRAFEDAAPWALGPRAARVVVVVVAALAAAGLSLLYDFARAARRTEPDVGAWRAYQLAWRALGGAWARALGVLAFWLVFGGVAVLGLLGLAWSGHAVSTAAILLQTLLQVAILAARSAARVGAWASELALYDERAAVRP